MKTLHSLSLIAISVLSFTVNAQTSGALDNSYGVGANGLATGDALMAGSYILALPNGQSVVAYNDQSNSFGYLRRLNANGTTDNSFGNSGNATIGQKNGIFDMELTASGKIIVCGQTTSAAFVGCFNPNGSVDNTFGTGGFTVINPLSNLMSEFRALEIQSDGKIVLCGIADQGLTMLARFNTNGSIDNSFATNGLFIIPNGTNELTDLWDLKIESSGKIIATGTKFSNSSFKTYTAKFTTSGAFDNTFGINGVFENFSATQGTRIHIQSDGKYVIAGSSNFDFAACRINPAGTIDPSYGTNGYVTYDLRGINEQDNGYTSILQPDGKLLIAGTIYKTTNDSTYAVILKLNSNGTKDISFGNYPGVQVNFMPSSYKHVIPNSIDLQSDGKIIMVNSAQSCTNSCVPHLLVTRNTNDVSLSVNTIPENGSQFNAFPNPASDNIMIAVTTDGKVDYSITNQMGQILKIGQIQDDETTVSVSDLTEGIYFLNITETGKTSYTKKIVVSR